MPDIYRIHEVTEALRLLSITGYEFHYGFKLLMNLLSWFSHADA
jgi:hypothetical protein